MADYPFVERGGITPDGRTWRTTPNGVEFYDSPLRHPRRRWHRWFRRG